MSDLNWSQGGQGAAGGAMTGASLGSVAGPWGTVIGGVAGGLIGGAAGLFGGSNDYEDRLRTLAEGYGSRAAPQAGAAAQAEYSAFRSNQAGLISQLESMARGQGPSLARQNMREAMDRAAGAQASGVAGAGGRGVNAGAALRNGLNNTAANNAQGNRDMISGSIAEQFHATDQLNQAISQGRYADENMNQYNAGAQNDMARANLQAQLESQRYNTDAQLSALGKAQIAAGPGMGTQLMGMGAQAVGPALQYHMGQQQMQQQQAMQQQYMQYMQQQQQQQMQPQQQYAQQMAASPQFQQQQGPAFNQLPSQRSPYLAQQQQQPAYPGPFSPFMFNY